jgi:hypothetical protein
VVQIKNLNDFITVRINENETLIMINMSMHPDKQKICELFNTKQRRLNLCSMKKKKKLLKKSEVRSPEPEVRNTSDFRLPSSVL